MTKTKLYLDTYTEDEVEHYAKCWQCTFDEALEHLRKVTILC